MEAYFRAAAGILVAVILGLAVSRHQKEAALLLTAAVCCMAAAVALSYLEPVMTLMKRLRQTAGLDGDLLACLLKIVGIGLIGEVAAAVCTDAGNGALGKTVQLLSAAAALWLAVPLFETLLTLLSTVLGEA